MEHLRRLILALALLLALPSVAQEGEADSFFSLNSAKTFSAAEKPIFQVWGQRIRKLQFRLYRVQDPAAFFLQLQDDHHFGGQPPRRDKAITRLEKIRAWKRRQRRNLTLFARAQFTSDARRSYRDWREPSTSRPSAASAIEYANIPVLNSQQLVATWEQSYPVKDWISETVVAPIKDKGLYLVEATDGKLQAYTIVSVTDLALISKSAPGKLMIRAVRRDTGAPVADCPISIYANDKKTRYGQGKTNADGYFETAVTDRNPESALILGRSENDFAAISTHGGSLSTDPEHRLTGYIYTDRPVYRPGHAVEFRGVFRVRQEVGYQVPANQEVWIEIQDSEGQSVHREKKRLSSMGTLNGTWTVPAAARLGYYAVQMQSGESVHSGGFMVEEYRKPEYQVRVIPEARRVLQGKPASVKIDARYFYGEPVAGAKVVYVVHRGRWWPPFYGDEEPDVSPGEEEDSPWTRQEQTEEQTGMLDADGKLTISVPTENAEYDLRYRIEARVTDAAGREISGTGFIVATVGPYLLRVRGDKYVYSAGETAKVQVESRDYDGNPVGSVPFELHWAPWEYRKGEGAALGRTNGITDAQGNASVEIALAEGLIRVTARTRTQDVRTVTDFEHLWVTGSASVWSSGQQRMEIIPDRKAYKPGDTAKILVLPGKPGAHVWVSAEGRGVTFSRFANPLKGSFVVEIPIRPEHLPNFFVTATAIYGNELLQGNKSIRVPPTDKQLQVELKPSKSEYKPGEPATYTVEARDAAGRPAAAEFSLGVVDEAVYAVRPDRTQDILQAFYGRDWNHISTDTSLHYYFQGDAGRRRMPLARIRPFRPNAQLKPESPDRPRIRKAFPDTAFWSPAVQTDSSGRAQVRFDYPDALTTWRATARGLTLDTKVGSAVHRVVVRKNLLIRLSTPRFFRQGDTMTITAIVQNLLPSEKKVRLSLDAQGLEIVEKGPPEITVPTRGTGTADFRVRVPASRQAVLLAKAITDEESDALELTIPVQPFGVRMTDPKSGTLDSASQADVPVSFAPDAEPSSRKLLLSIAPSVGGTIFDALDYLTNYPYGCTEQTMSSFLPNVIVSRAVRDLGLHHRIDETELQKKIRAGLDRLYDFQHEDGGWGWWKADESTIFMTAYVAAGLRQAELAGVKVESSRIRRAVEWLVQQTPVQKEPAELRAYVAYTLAMSKRNDPARLNDLFQQRSSLSSQTVALLGLAMAESGDARANELSAQLESQAKTSANEAWWGSDRDELMGLELDTSSETTAYALKLLARTKPQSPLVNKAALYLVNHRSQGYWWNSTKHTAMVIFGLIDYLKQSGEMKPNQTVTVTLNDQPVLTKKFTESELLSPVTLEIDSARLNAGQNRLRITRQGEGRVYWSATPTWHSNAAKPSLPGRDPLEIAREYFRLAPSRDGGRVAYQLAPLQSQVKQGDVLAVRLRVKGHRWRYLMVEDPIPSGAEIIQRDELYEVRNQPPWWKFSFTSRELRDDRAVFFQTYGIAGEMQYVYLIKIVNPGQFRVSPARVEPMYQPEFFAASESRTVEVER